MAAPLRCDLVFDMDAGDPTLLVLAHGPHRIQFVAVTGVRIGDHRDVDGADDARGVADHLRHRQQAKIGIAKRGGGARAGHVDRVEAGLLD
jgi:hypothetical protein